MESENDRAKIKEVLPVFVLARTPAAVLVVPLLFVICILVLVFIFISLSCLYSLPQSTLDTAVRFASDTTARGVIHSRGSLVLVFFILYDPIRCQQGIKTKAYPLRRIASHTRHDTIATQATIRHLGAPIASRCRPTPE